MLQRSLVLALLCGAAVMSVGSTAEYNPARTRFDGTIASGPQRVIVRFRDSGLQGTARAKPPAEMVGALARRTGVAVKVARPVGGGLHVLELPAATPVQAAADLARLQSDPEVVYVEPDRRRFPHAVPNDPGFAGQWYLQDAATTPSAVDAIAAWDVTTGGAGVVVADIDTGVRYDHPDLLPGNAAGRLLPGFDFISNSANANDDDGWDADPSDPGDWLTTTEAGSSEFAGCPVSDSSWHGTRVAGIIGARTNNAEGVAGLGWSGWVLPVRVLGKCGGDDSDILSAMLWAGGIAVNDAPANPYPAKIINMSLGGSGTCPQAYRDVVRQLEARGVLVVASAGNDGGEVDSPANCPGVAAIGAIRHAGTKVGFSNLGGEIAVSAPGGNCVNVGAGQPCLYSIDTTTNLGTRSPTTNTYSDQFNFNVGTSFSAPIVSGIAGLMASVNGRLSSAQLIARLKEGARRPFPESSDPAIQQCRVPSGPFDVQLEECECTTETCGAGMANAPGAVEAALRPVAAVAVPASVRAGQDVVLRAGGSGAACGRSISQFAWTIVNGGPTPPAIQGANTDTAVVVAPSSDSFIVRLVVTDDAGRSDAADVTVSANAASTDAPAAAGGTACLPPVAGSVPVSVSVSPTSASVRADGGTQMFTASVTNAAVSGVTWLVNGTAGGDATMGTITGAGVYSAPDAVPNPSTVTVTAVSRADPTRSASATVTILPPSPPIGGSGGGGGGGSGAIGMLTLLLLLGWGLLSRRPAASLDRD
jgi:serine protease